MFVIRSRMTISSILFNIYYKTCVNWKLMSYPKKLTYLLAFKKTLNVYNYFIYGDAPHINFFLPVL